MYIEVTLNYMLISILDAKINISRGGPIWSFNYLKNFHLDIE